MAPPNKKNNRRIDDATSDNSSNLSTGTEDISSYDGGSESSCVSTGSSATSPSRRSRLDSFLSSRSPSGRQRRHSSSRSGSGMSTASESGSSLKSILKKKKRLQMKKKSKSPVSSSLKKKKGNVRPIGQISMIKNPVIRHQVRGFVSEYSQNPEFEAFSLSVDGIPFVALSLMNADHELRSKFKKSQPPTPMKRHTPGINSPRKRPLGTSRYSRSSSNSKCVRFTDEEASPKKARKSSSAEQDEELRELGETVSDAMIETDRQYNDLWSDRVNSNEK